MKKYFQMYGIWTIVSEKEKEEYDNDDPLPIQILNGYRLGENHYIYVVYVGKKGFTLPENCRKIEIGRAHV